MVPTPVQPLTLDAFLQLPETQPASEFINNQLIQWMGVIWLLPPKTEY